MSEFKEWWKDECCGITFDYPNESALYAWEHQQVKIDKLKNIIQMQEFGVEAIKQTLNEIYDACDEDETVAMLLDKIQELLK